MTKRYVPPSVGAKAFHCPHCEAFAHQEWQKIKWTAFQSTKNPYQARINKCQMCSEYGIWVNGDQVYPPNSPAPLPNDDMPEAVEQEYHEARKVVGDSPKAAAAILRLAMEKLTQQLTDEQDQSLYQNIGDLLEEGRIDSRMQEALDSVRVAGNDYVHAGEIYEDDDAETAIRLFRLVNIIVEMTISRENLIEESYSEIPENKLNGIQQRDGN